MDWHSQAWESLDYPAQDNLDMGMLSTPMEFDLQSACIGTTPQNVAAACQGLPYESFTAWDQFGSQSVLPQHSLGETFQSPGFSDTNAAYPVADAWSSEDTGHAIDRSMVGRSDQCPSCLEPTLQKIDEIPWGVPPAASRGEVFGLTPELFEQQSGKRCDWTLIRCTCRCSPRLFWTFALRPWSKEETLPSSRRQLSGGKHRASSRPSAKSRRGDRVSAASATYGSHSRSISQSSIETGFTSSSPTSMPNDLLRKSPGHSYTNYTSSDDGSLSDYQSHMPRSVPPNPPRPYPLTSQPYDSCERSRSQIDSTPQGIESPRTSPGRASETPSDSTQSTKTRRRQIKDGWKYKFHHQYGACAPCRGKRAGCSPKHLDEETLRKVPDEVWEERPYPGWRPHWIKPATPPANDCH